jgi:nicotinate-nucleotide adenylyltransferase
MKRVGILAGTFDPVHDGHLAFAHQALKECGLDKIFFLVEPRPRRKQGVKALEHRLQMVQLAIKDESKFGTIMLEQTRFSVTETLPVLKELFKGAQMNLLFGDDVLNHLAQWPHVDQLVRDVSFIIGVRQHTPHDVESHLQNLQRTRGLKLHYSLFVSTAPRLSSSYIRASIKHGHRPHGLQDAVRAYISENGLYSSGINS